MAKSKNASKAKEIVRELIINGIIVALIVIIGFAGVMFVSYKMYIPEYTATALINVANMDEVIAGACDAYITSSDTQSSAVVANNVKIYLTRSQTLKEGVLSHLGWESFEGTVSAVVVPDSTFVEVTVTSSDAEKVYDYMVALLHVADDEFEDVFPSMDISVVESPTMPDFPSNNIFDLKSPLFIGYFVCIGLLFIASIAINIFRIVGIIKRKI